MADKITTSRFSLEELPDALEQILTEYQSAMFDTRQEALQAGAEVFKSAVESATPIDTGEMARSSVVARMRLEPEVRRVSPFTKWS